MPLDTDLWLAMAVVVGAGVISGLAGFGFGLASVPPLLLIYDPPTVVAIGSLIVVVTLWVVVWGAWGEIRVRTVAGLGPGAAVGLVVGVTLLRRLEPDAIRLLAGATVAGFSLLLLSGARVPGAGSRWAVPIAGFASGALNASVGVSGPPVVALLAARNLPPAAFRTTATAYFLLVNGATLVVLAWQHLLTRDHLVIAALLIPGALLGTALGRRLVRFVSPLAFRRITLGLLLATGLSAAAGALARLWW